MNESAESSYTGNGKRLILHVPLVRNDEVVGSIPTSSTKSSITYQPPRVKLVTICREHWAGCEVASTLSTGLFGLGATHESFPFFIQFAGGRADGGGLLGLGVNGDQRYSPTPPRLAVTTWPRAFSSACTGSGRLSGTERLPSLARS